MDGTLRPIEGHPSNIWIGIVGIVVSLGLISWAVLQSKKDSKEQLEVGAELENRVGG
jgi:hypothetical protein